MEWKFSFFLVKRAMWVFKLWVYRFEGTTIFVISKLFHSKAFSLEKTFFLLRDRIDFFFLSLWIYSLINSCIPQPSFFFSKRIPLIGIFFNRWLDPFSNYVSHYVFLAFRFRRCVGWVSRMMLCASLNIFVHLCVNFDVWMFTNH